MPSRPDFWHNSLRRLFTNGVIGQVLEWSPWPSQGNIQVQWVFVQLSWWVWRTEIYEHAGTPIYLYCTCAFYVTLFHPQWLQQQVADRSLQVIEIDLSDVLKVIDNRHGNSSLEPSFSRFYVVSSSKTTQSLSEICRRILFATSDTSKTKWINCFPKARLDVNGLMW